MCGIAGIVGLHRDSANAVVHAMLNSLAHRGPDDAGTWLSDNTTLCLGHRRLSIIDTSPAGHQPMMSVHKRYVLVYNGEVYNSQELRLALERDNAAPAWRGHSDTEVVLAGFEHWGIVETLRRCNGMFAMAVWDCNTRMLTLARDRMGEKPLYFGWVAGRFCFASELKALSMLPQWSARMAPAAILSFLTTGYVRGPQSAITGVFRLPPACILALNFEELHTMRDWAWLENRILRYWSIKQTALHGNVTPLNDVKQSLNTLETLLADAVRLRMIADVPLGAFLSGGIDSSLVVSLMQAQSATPIHTFSIGFTSSKYNEAPHAKAIARHLGTIHTELYVGPNEALSLVPQLAWTFDEPFADNSQIPTMLLAALARKDVTVALSGDAGDELFAGYGRYISMLKLWNFLDQLPLWLRRHVPTMLSRAASLFRFIPFIQSFPYKLDRLAERLTVHNIDAMRLSFIAGKGITRVLSEHYIHDLTHCTPPVEIEQALQRMMYGDQVDYLPDDILHKVDRATMWHSLEARVPLLDHRVVEFAWCLPPSTLLKDGKGKQPLRHILARYVPTALFDRPKQGFVTPMALWLRGPLREWAESLLCMESLRDLPMLDPASVCSLWHAHLDGRTDAAATLWNVLMLSEWRNRFQATI